MSAIPDCSGIENSKGAPMEASWADNVIVRLYVWLHGSSVLRYWGDAQSFVGQVGREEVQARLSELAAAADRRLSHQLTAGGFVVAIAGFSTTNGSNHGVTLQSVAGGLAGLIGTFAFLCALRGSTRIVDRHSAVRDLVAADTESSWRALECKLCWIWASIRTLRVAIALLATLYVLNGLAL